MKGKKIEKMIYESLNADKPSESVLERARAELAAKKAEEKPRIGHLKAASIIASCLVIAMFLSLCGWYTYSYFFVASGPMKDYVDLSLLEVKEFENIDAYNSLNGTDLLGFDYEVETCKVYIGEDGKPVCVKESYLVDGEQSLTMWVVYPEYPELNRISEISRYRLPANEYNSDKISYSVMYDICRELPPSLEIIEFSATAQVDGYTYIVVSDTDSEELFFSQLEEVF